jgi:hypothetical protein
MQLPARPLQVHAAAPQHAAQCPHGASAAQCQQCKLRLQEIKARMLDVMLEKDLHPAPSPRRAALEAELASLAASKAALQGAIEGATGSPAPGMQVGAISSGFNPQQQQQSRFGGPAAPFAPPGFAAGPPGPAPQGSSAAWSSGPSWSQPPMQPFQPHIPAAAPAGPPQGYGACAAPGQWGSGGGYAWSEAGAGGEPYDRVPNPSLRQGMGGAAAEGVEEIVECQQTEGGADSRWEGAFPWSADLARSNEDFFANTGFRPNQRQAINATLSGKDVFVLMPTGGGAFPLLYMCVTP